MSTTKKHIAFDNLTCPSCYSGFMRKIEDAHTRECDACSYEMKEDEYCEYSAKRQQYVDDIALNVSVKNTRRNFGKN
jgi:hypothetical protein